MDARLKFHPAALLTLIITVCLMLSAALTHAQNGYPPASDNYVNDFANRLDAQTITTLRDQLRELESTHDIEMTVVVINSLDNYTTGDDSLAAFANGMFNAWGVGDAVRNNGVLLIAAIRDRQIRIELGAGYADDYDAQMATILSEFVLPEFRDEQYADGITRGVNAIIRTLTEPGTVPQSQPAQSAPQSTTASDSDSGLPVPLIAGAVAVIGVGGLLLFGRGGGGGHYASTFKCPECRKPMHALTEAHEIEKHLTKAQRMEQRAHDALYQVWVCQKGHVLAEAPKVIKRATGCPECGAKTYHKGATRTVEPTEEARGKTEYDMICDNCGFRQTQTKTVERLKTAAERAEEERRIGGVVADHAKGITV